jgi:hypothetical protein
MKTSIEGYRHNSPDNKEPSVIIPSNKIDMKDTIHEYIYAVPYKNGQPQKAVLMKRGGEYNFEGADYVMEIPHMQMGGGVQYPYQPTPNYFSPQPNYGSVYSVDANGNPVSVPSTGVMTQEEVQKNQQALDIMSQGRQLVPPTSQNQQPGIVSLTDEELGINQPIDTQELDLQAQYDRSVKDLAWAKTLPKDNAADNYDTNLSNDYEQWLKNSENNTTIPEHNVQNPNQSQLYNPYSSYDTSSAAFTLGNAIGGGTPAYRGGLAAGKIALSLTRDIASGVGAGKRQKFLQDEYDQRTRDSITGLEDGGQFNLSQALLSPQQFMQSGGQMSQAQSLTGEYLQGQPDGKEEGTVVELEKGEHVLKPDGTASEVVGQKHSQGGEKLTAQQIEEGSIVISDHLKVGKKNAKYFRDKYGITLKAKDTYATVIDKVKDKVGITKVTKEQEEAFKQLEKQEKNTEDDNTKNINREFLSKKINDLEKEKEQLEPARIEAMKEVYQKQEESKPKEKSEPLADPNLVAQLAQQNRLAPEEAQGIIEQFLKGGEYKKMCKKMQDGGPLTTEDIASVNEATGITFSDEAANSLFIKAPKKQTVQESTDPLNYGWYKDEGYIDVQRNGEDYIINPTPKNPYNYVDYIKMVDRIKQLNPNQKIVPNYIPFENRASYQSGGTIKYSDPKAIEQLEKLRKKYPDNFNQAFEVRDTDGKKIYVRKEGFDMADANTYFFTDLSKITADQKEKEVPLDLQPRQPNISINGTGLPYGYKEINPMDGLPDFSKTVMDPPVDGIANTDSTKQAGNPLQNLPLLPDQSVLPPSSMQPPLKVENRLQRVDSVNISPEQQLAENQRQAQAIQSLIGDLPPNQRAAMMAQILGQTQNANNQAISQANIQNAQIDNQTQLYNAQIADKEDLLRGENALSYEDRVFRTQAVYDENINQYYDYLRNVRTQNFNDVRNQNTINQMFENYNVDSNGNIILTPQELQLAISRGTVPTTTTTKKK